MARFDRALQAPKPPEFEAVAYLGSSSGISPNRETYPWDSIKLFDQSVITPGPTVPRLYRPADTKMRS